MLAGRGCERVTLAGGSILNCAFVMAQLINEVILNIESVIVGRGIPLFATEDVDLKLQLEHMRQVNDRIVQLRYTVLKP